MASTISIVLEALGLNAFKRISTGAANMSADMKRAAAGMSKEYAAAAARAQRLEDILKRRPNSLGLQVAAKQAQELRDRLRDAAVQADKTNRALNDIKSPDFKTRMGGYNAAAESLQERRQQYAPLRQELESTRNLGLGGVAVGGAGLAALFKGAVSAGDFERKRKSVEAYEGGGKLFEDLKAFDQRSPFDFDTVVGQAQSALAQGFKTSEIIPLFDTLGDQVIKSGGGIEEFNRALTQLSQIKSKGVASMQDIKAIAEGAKIPVIPILEEQLGKERTAKILSGDEPIAADEMFSALTKGMQARSKGAMGEAMNLLPGQLENLTGQFHMLTVELSMSLAPAVGFAVNILTGITTFFRGLPGPVKTIVAWGAALTFGLILLGGAAIATAAQIGLARLAMQGMGGAGGLGSLIPMFGSVTGSIGTAVSALGGLGAILSVALPLAIAAGVALMYRKMHDEMNKASESPEPAKDLGSSKTQEGALKQATDLERRADEIDPKIETLKDYKAWGLFFGKSEEEFDYEIKGAKAEQQTLRAQAARLRKQAASTAAAPDAPATAPTAPATNMALPVAPGMPGIPGATGASTVSANTNIESLEDAKAAADSKEERKRLTEELRLARRADKHSKAAQRATDRLAKAEEREAKRLRKVHERQLEKQRKAQVKHMDAMADASSDVAIAQLEADTDVRINELESQKTDDNESEIEKQIAELRAQAVEKHAQLQAAGLKGATDAAQRERVLKLGKIEADKIRRLSAIDKKKKDSWSGAINRLRGGSSLAQALNQKGRSVLSDLNTRAANALGGGAMFNPYANAAYAGTEGAFSITHPLPGANDGLFNGIKPIGAAQRDNVLKVGKPRYEQDSDGGWKVEFPPLRVPKDSFDRMGDRL